MFKETTCNQKQLRRPVSSNFFMKLNLRFTLKKSFLSEKNPKKSQWDLQKNPIWDWDFQNRKSHMGNPIVGYPMRNPYFHTFVFPQYNYEQEVDPKEVVTNPKSPVKTNVEDVSNDDLVSFMQDSNIKKLLLLLYYKKYGKMPGEFPMSPAKPKLWNRRTHF